MNYDDYYYEPSEADEFLEEFKERIFNSVKDEHKSKMELLVKQNAELKAKVKNVDDLEREYKQKISTLEAEKAEILRDAKREIYNATLQGLFDNCSLFQKAYGVDTEYIAREKCSLCDDNRQLIAVSPDGKNHKVACSCNNRDTKYVTKEKKEITCYVQKGAKSDNFKFEFRNKETYIDGYKVQICEKFDESNPPKSYYNTYFTSIEETQKYCDWLNSKSK